MPNYLGALVPGLLLPLALPSPWIGMALGLTVAVSVALPSIPPTRRRLGVVLSLGLLATSARGVLWQSEALPEACWRRAYHATVDVVDFPRRDTGLDGAPLQRFAARVISADTPVCQPGGEVQLTLYAASPVLRLGDRVDAQIALRPPSSQWSPGVLPDQARHAAQNRRAVGTLKTVVARQHVGGGLRGWRSDLGDAIDSAGLPARHLALLRALIVGDGAAMAEDDWLQFRQLGLAHVLVISGLHIGLVAAGVWLLVGIPRRLARLPGDAGGEWLRTAITLAGAALYAGLAGFTVPTQRALVMLAVVLGARAAGWRSGPLRAVAAALAVVLFIDPHTALGSGLWMSAGATAALLLLSRRQPREWRWLLRGLWLQCALLLVLFPLTLFWFGEASLLAVVTNLTVVPVMGIWVIPFGLLGAAVAGVSGPTATLLWQLAAWPITPLLSVMDLLHAQAATVAVLEHTVSGVELTGLTLLGLVWVYRRRWQERALPRRLLTALLMMALFWGMAGPTREPVAELAALDVGQGTAIVLRVGRRVMVYDTGGGVPGRFLQLEKIVLPYLAQTGVRAIDTLVVSHGDADHSSGMERLYAEFAIRKHLGFGGEPCRPGYRWEWPSEVSVTVLHGTGQAPDARNAGSCVLMIRIADKRFLLAGDIPLAVERELVRYWRQALKADVLFLGHHGSITSSGYTWLKWVSPRTAVATEGLGNRFGHPHPTVRERVQQLGAELLQTSRSGTLVWRLDADGGWRRSAQRGPFTPYWLRLP